MENRVTSAGFFGVIAIAVLFTQLELHRLRADLDVARADIRDLRARAAPATTATACTACPASTSVPWPGRSPVFSAGLDHSVELEGNVAFARGPTLDLGHVLYPAVQTAGSALINGSLVVTGSLLLFDTSSQTYHNITRFLETLRIVPAEVCVDGAACVEGFTNVWDCSCICNEGWVGDNCSTSLCSGRGNWSELTRRCTCEDPGGLALPFYSADTYCAELDCGAHGVFAKLTGACVCESGWTGASCRAPLEPAGCGVCYGECINDVCTCLHGQTGEACEFNCANGTIDTAVCPYRTNWGVSLDCVEYVLGGAQQCVCGGGYQYASPDARIMYMECPAGSNLTECRARFLGEAPLCCAPGVDCTQASTRCGAEDPICCAQAHGQDLVCMALGCAVCGDFCVPRDLANDACATSAVADVLGNWREQDVACPADKPGTICNSAARLSYLSIYESCYSVSGPPGDACLASAYTQVQTMPWVMLDVFPDFDSSLWRHIAAATPACSDGRAPLLTVDAPDSYRPAARLSWQCRPPRSRSAFQLRLAATTAFVTDAALSYHVLLRPSHGNMFCLKYDAAMDAAKSLFYFGSSAAPPLFAVNLRESENGHTWTPTSFCSPFQVFAGLLTAVDGRSLAVPRSVPSGVDMEALGVILDYGFYNA